MEEALTKHKFIDKHSSKGFQLVSHRGVLVCQWVGVLAHGVAGIGTVLEGRCRASMAKE